MGAHLEPVHQPALNTHPTSVTSHRRTYSILTGAPCTAGEPHKAGPTKKLIDKHKISALSYCLSYCPLSSRNHITATNHTVKDKMAKTNGKGNCTCSLEPLRRDTNPPRVQQLPPSTPAPPGAPPRPPSTQTSPSRPSGRRPSPPTSGPPSSGSTRMPVSARRRSGAARPS